MPDPARPDDPDVGGEPDARRPSGDDARPELVAVGDDHEPSPLTTRRERKERLEALTRAAREQAREASRSLAVLSAKVASSRRGMARQTADLDRLRTEVNLFARELEVLTARKGAGGSGWAIATDGLLADSAQALAAGEATESWHLLLAAKRQAYDGRTRDELAAEVRSVIADARSVLSAGEARHIAEDLGSIKPKDRLDAVRVRLAAARRQIDEALVARQERYRVAARGLVNTGVLLGLILLGGAVAAWLSTSMADEGEALRNLDNYVTVAALGGMGVALSLLLPWHRNPTRPAVLDFVNPLDITFLRVVLGVGVAMAVVTVLQSDLQAGLDLGGVKAYPWAIAAGFSERLLDKRLLAIDDEVRQG